MLSASHGPLLVTGFGPFGSVAENPSGWLAEHSGHPYRLIEVSFAATDEFVTEAPSLGYERFLLMGVSGGAERFHLETVARNEIGPTPDVRGVVAGPGPADPSIPARLGGTLWQTPGLVAEHDPWAMSTDAGTYLCNYLFFRVVQACPAVKVGFLHVPLAEKVPLETQLEWLKALLNELLEADER